MFMPPDERPFPAATRSNSGGPTHWFPLTAGFSSPLEQYTTESTHEPTMFNTSPFTRATNYNERMLDVEVWVADSTEGSEQITPISEAKTAPRLILWMQTAMEIWILKVLWMDKYNVISFNQFCLYVESREP